MAQKGKFLFLENAPKNALAVVLVGGGKVSLGNGETQSHINPV